MLISALTGKAVKISYPGLTSQDVADFCRNAEVDFLALGTLGAWDDETMFYAAPSNHEGRNRTFEFAVVLKWKQVRDMIAEAQLSPNSRFRHYKGGIYTVVCKASDERTQQPVIVYRDVQGKTWVRPQEDFRSVVTVDGEMMPRFTYIGPGY